MLLLLRSLLSDVLRSLVSVLFVVLVVVLRLLLSFCDEFMLLLVRLLSFCDEFMLLLLRSLLSLALLVFVLRLLLSFCEEFMLLLLPLSVVVLVVVMLRFDVTVLPPRAVMSSAAEALSEKASEMAVTSKVLFIRFPLWV
jgi:hypothetical protein